MTKHLFNEDKRDALLSKIERLGGVSNNTVFVSVDEFFAGNYDKSSIGCNLLDHPGIDTFYEILSSLLDDDAVESIRVEIFDADDDSWPYAEKVWINTTLSEQEVNDICSDLQFDEIWEDSHDDIGTDEHTLFVLWWD